MANRMDGKCAVVTGAASGMGKATAVAFLKEGAKVVAGDIHMDRLAQLEKEMEELGLKDSLRTVKCDITSNEDCANAVKVCAEAFGTHNVLAHCAGIADTWVLLHDLPDDKWEKQIAVNMTGAMRMTRETIRYFLANDIKGSIVMITSNAVFESCTGGAGYSAAKAGANSLMRSISFTYARRGIRCNAILPGPISSNIMESVEAAGGRNPEGTEVHYKTGYNAHCREWALKPYAKADEIGPLAVFLASDESGFITGDSILFDGGVGLSVIG